MASDLEKAAETQDPFPCLDKSGACGRTPFFVVETVFDDQKTAGLLAPPVQPASPQGRGNLLRKLFTFLSTVLFMFWGVGGDIRWKCFC